MVCKNCGNVIATGTYCLRCGTENNENLKNELLEETQKEFKSNNDRNKNLKSILKIVIVWIIILMVIGITQNIMESSYDSCVNTRGHSECGLGALCDHECMPPFYLTISIISSILHIISIIAIPGLLLLGIIVDKANDKKSN